MPVACFWKHVATDGSLLGVSGWSACDWSVVQLDHHAEMANACDVPYVAELEVQRTVREG